MKTETLINAMILTFYNRISAFISRFFLLIIIILPASAFSANALHLAVASNFIAPIKQIALDFEQETGTPIQLSFGSSGKLYAQIIHHAPYDIFLSADTLKPQALIESRHALPDSLVTYAKGKLALWSVDPFNATSLEKVLLEATRIAIANPKLAPYGKAARESMDNLFLWNQVKSKVVQGENIGQTYQFVYSQNAEVGFVAYSQVLSGKLKGHALAVPDNLHKDIEQSGVILSRSQNIQLAQEFMAFLMRPDTQAKITSFGYTSALD